MLPLDAQDAWLAAIVESSQDAIIGKSTKGIVTSWNPAAQTLFGYRPDEMLGSPILRLFPPDRVEEEERILARIQAGERVPHFATERLRKDGSRIQVSVTISPVRNACGQVVGASKIARDITAQRNLQLALERMSSTLDLRVADRTRKLELANQEMEAFTAAVSHDLSAPLRELAASCHALREDFPLAQTPLAVPHLQQIAAAAHRMETLVNGLLDLAHHTRGPLHRIELPVADLVSRSWGTLAQRQQLALPPCKVECRHALFGDPRMVQVLFDKLLGNALTYAGEQAPQVEVYQQSDPDGVLWTCIRDHGIGFDEVTAEHLFEPLRRLRPASRVLGLGLATVKRVVMRHGGQIMASGAPGAGAEFRFHLGASDGWR